MADTELSPIGHYTRTPGNLAVSIIPLATPLILTYRVPYI